MARRETPGGAASFGEYPARSTSSIAAIVPSRLNSAVACAALPEYGSQTTDGLVLGDSAALGVLRIDPGSMRDTAALPRRKFYATSSRRTTLTDLLCADRPMSFIAQEVVVTAGPGDRCPGPA